MSKKVENKSGSGFITLKSGTIRVTAKTQKEAEKALKEAVQAKKQKEAENKLKKSKPEQKKTEEKKPKLNAKEFEKRESERFDALTVLKTDELKNGLEQGKILWEHETDCKQYFPSEHEKVFSKLCGLLGEQVSEARKKIKRYLLVQSLPCDMEKEALSMLRGTVLDVCRDLTKTELTEKLIPKITRRFKGMTSSNKDIKTIRTELNLIAKKVLIDRIKPPSTKPRTIKKNGDKTGKVNSEPISAGEVNHVDNIPVNKGWNIPNPDKINETKKRENKLDAIVQLFRSTKQIAIMIQDEPLDFLPIESFQEVLTLANDTIADLSILAKRLQFTVDKNKSKQAA